MAYKMALPTHLRIHDFFHISLLRKYVYESTHIIDWNVVQVEPEGKSQVEPVHILDKKETILWNQVITWVKVQWKHFTLEEATWELEDGLRKKYPGLFPQSMEETENMVGNVTLRGKGCNIPQFCNIF